MQQIQPVQVVHPHSDARHPVPQAPANDKTMIYISLAAVFMAALGSLTGWGIYRTTSAATPGGTSQAVLSDTTSEQVDESQFSDNPDAEGTLVKGGADGEGTHKLEQGLGPDQDVYLLSNVLDLDSFIGKKVQIWGNKISAKNADWIMEVGRVKVMK